MHNIENSVAAQRHMFKLFSAAELALSCHPGGIHKRIRPDFDGEDAEPWEKLLTVEARYDHSFPVDSPEMPLDERPPDADPSEGEYSLLRVSYGSRVVMEVRWNMDGWFGYIEPGVWEILFVRWTIFWHQSEGDDVAPAA
jgi:hypothetical protein